GGASRTRREFRSLAAPVFLHSTPTPEGARDSAHAQRWDQGVQARREHWFSVPVVSAPLDVPSGSLASISFRVSPPRSHHQGSHPIYVELFVSLCRTEYTTVFQGLLADQEKELFLKCRVKKVAA